MTIITRNNYEEFFLDYIEEEISAQNKELLEAFLVQHPDLKKELDEMMGKDFTCEATSVKTEFASLKKIPFQANFDDFCIAHLEGDLNKYEKKAFENFIASQPEKEKDLNLYHKIKLTANTSLVFTDKKGLKRRNKAIVFRQFVFTTLATAASIAILFSVWTTEIETGNSNLKPELVSHNTNSQVPDRDTTKKSVPEKVKTVDKKSNKSKEADKPKKTKIKGKIINKQIIKIDALPQRSEVQKKEEINKLEVTQLLADNKIVPIENSHQVISELAKVNATKTNVKQNTGLAMLGLSWKASKEEKSGKEKSTLLKIASYGVNQIGKLAGKKINLEKKYDPKTDKTRVAFNTLGIGFSTPVK